MIRELRSPHGLQRACSSRGQGFGGGGGGGHLHASHRRGQRLRQRCSTAFDPAPVCPAAANGPMPLDVRAGRFSRLWLQLNRCVRFVLQPVSVRILRRQALISSSSSSSPS